MQGFALWGGGGVGFYACHKLVGAIRRFHIPVASPFYGLPIVGLLRLGVFTLGGTNH